VALVTRDLVVFQNATKEVLYNPLLVEFLVDVETGEWFFIEMNPRVQVEHTVTEEITAIDIVQSQIQIAMGHTLHGEFMGLPEQDKVEKSGFAIQCRITTEDPENNFTPDFGKILTYRSAGGFGVRLDGALGTSNAVITPYYDSMLVKMTVFARTYQQALDRMDRGRPARPDHRLVPQRGHPPAPARDLAAQSPPLLLPRLRKDHPVA
jgi:pyruvate carboxylase